MPSSPKSLEKQERLAAALRENLKRRKTQAREKAQDAGLEDQPSGKPSTPQG